MISTRRIIQDNRLIRIILLLNIIGITAFVYTSFFANSNNRNASSTQELHIPYTSSVSSKIYNLIQSSGFQKLIEDRIESRSEHASSNDLWPKYKKENPIDDNVYYADNDTEQSGYVRCIE